jgi:hypothetical protein
VNRRILIIDLDCPFGINHFDLVECDSCAIEDTTVNTGLVTTWDGTYSGNTTFNITWDTSDLWTDPPTTATVHFDHTHVTVTNTTADTS